MARAVVALERAVTGAEALEGVVLRYGFFYGPGTAYGAGGSFVEDVRRRRLPIVGAGTGLASFVAVDDAAAATLLALDRAAPGIYNVTDDEPIAQREWVRVLADALGAPAPAGSAVARAPARRGRGDRRGDRPRGVERQGTARARLGAAVAERPRRLPGSRGRRRAGGRGTVHAGAWGDGMNAGRAA